MTLAANIILFGPISNAHCNPAVTLAVLIRETAEKRSKGKLWFLIRYMLKIWLSQIAGAVLGALVIAAVRQGEDMGTARLCSPIGGAKCESNNGNAFKMLLAETIGSFLYISININIIYFNGSPELAYNGLIIGLALALGMGVTKTISGGSLNPAVGLVLPLM